MTGRLPSHLLASALIRRIHDAGGSAMVLAKGHADAGAMLILTLERGENPIFFERGLGRNGTVELIRAGPADLAESSAVNDYWRRRRENDPDLWVIEVNIAGAERFVAETILQG